MIDQNELLSVDPNQAKPTMKPAFQTWLSSSSPHINQETQKTVTQLLVENHKAFHIFFNEMHLHNHLTHHVLAAYSVGASSNQLKHIFDLHAKTERPKPPHKITITKDNWTEFLGKAELWTDYLTFFDAIVKEMGMTKAIQEFGFHPLMLPRLVSGLFHPLIHIGEGIEFQIPMMVAEGLAEAAVHRNYFEQICEGDFWTKSPGDSAKIFEILDSIHNDSQFNDPSLKEDGLMDPAIIVGTICKQKSPEIRGYAKRWKNPENEELLQERLRELYEASLLIYGAQAQVPGRKEIKLDFFAMHSATSVYFLDVLFPILTTKQKASLLDMYFVSMLVCYIRAGSLKLYPDLVLNYSPKMLKNEEDPWTEAIQEALKVNKPDRVAEESHVLKIVRSLLKAQNKFGSEKNDLYLKMAQLTIEAYSEFGWTFD